MTIQVDFFNTCENHTIVDLLLLNLVIDHINSWFTNLCIFQLTAMVPYGLIVLFLCFCLLVQNCKACLFMTIQLDFLWWFSCLPFCLSHPRWDLQISWLFNTNPLLLSYNPFGLTHCFFYFYHISLQVCMLSFPFQFIFCCLALSNKMWSQLYVIGYPGQQRAKVAELSKFGRPVSIGTSNFNVFTKSWL